MDVNVNILKEFCGGEVFWNGSSVFKRQPEFSACFINTALVWIPYGCVWFITPLFVWSMCVTGGNKPLPLAKLSLSKGIMSLLAAVMVSVQLLYVHLSNGGYVGMLVSAAYDTACGIKMTTFVMTVILQQYQRLRGIQTSAVPFVCWTIIFVFEIPRLYTNITNQAKVDCLPGYYIYILVISVQLILHCFAEQHNRVEFTEVQDQISCPEENASSLNHILYEWISPVLRMINRKTFDANKLWKIPSRMKNETVGPRLETAWNEEIDRCRKARNKYLNGSYKPYKPYVENFINSEDTPLLPRKRILTTNNDKDISVDFQPSLYKTLARLYWKYWFEATMYLAIAQILWYMVPSALQAMIYLIQSHDTSADDPIWMEYFYCILIVVLTFTNTTFFHTYCTHMLVLGLNVKSALMALIYKKALKMRTSGNRHQSDGDIVNHMSVDCQRIQDAFLLSAYMLSFLITAAVIVVQLWTIMGSAAAGCLVLLLTIVPIVCFIGTEQFKVQKELLKLKGSRTKILQEIVNGIKTIKMYAWETPFIRKIKEIRAAEVNKLWKYAWLSAIAVVVGTYFPFILNFTLITTHILTSPTKSLHPEQIFAALAILNILRFTLVVLPSTVNGFVQAYTSIGRLQAFLLTPDKNEKNTHALEDADFAIKIEDGNFAWMQDSVTGTLKDINLQVNDGELIAVVGQAGSGKTSLIAACLGEMERLQGSVKTKGSIAYVPQSPWIQNMSLKDNIMFGMNLKKKKYAKIIKACALVPDLTVLPDGDNTEIGERGINISGGQKQRISLARAVYNDADIFFLDDPLSALDPLVGKTIFQEVIGNTGLLKNKTRILVTHSVHWLPMMDRIVTIVDGRISEIGAYAELISRNGPFARILEQYMQEDNGSDQESNETFGNIGAMTAETTVCLSTDNSKCGSNDFRKREFHESQQVELDRITKLTKCRLTETEVPEIGGIKSSVFLNFIKAIGVIPFALFIICMSIYQGANTFSSILLSIWTQTDIGMQNSSTTAENATTHSDDIFFLLCYLGLGVLQGIFISIAFYCVLTRMARASGKLHDEMLEGVLRSACTYFDRTTTGRIMNRFSSDIDVIDTQLPIYFRLLAPNVFSVLAILTVVTIMTPVFIAIAVVAGVVYVMIMRYALPSVQEMRRLEAVRRSPIYNHFIETLSGSSVIRAYKCEQRFIEEFRKRMDANSVFYYASIICPRWIGIRIGTFSNLVVLVTNVITVASGFNGSQVGLSISFTMLITVTVNVVSFSVCQLLMNMVSIEGVAACSTLPAEKYYHYYKAENSKLASCYYRGGWPKSGRIEFNDFWTRYRHDLDYVLKGINLTMKNGEKVGLVGRTGAGKSSLTLSLFRILDAVIGTLYIDGIDIKQLDLNTLRNNLTILPQEPVLFSGSIRFNLDPFGCYNDEQIWHVIDCAHLKKFVQNLENGLQYDCGESGQNLSIGQKQLLCLARALLHKTRILVLDEATSAVDMETDDIIQDTIRTQFYECTVLTIAHRLHTVIDYDRIIVMENGCIIEDDAPEILLQDSNTTFYNMAKDAGII